MNNQGVLTIISGFSGSGKGTAVKILCDKYDYALSVSATTRAPREGEADGVHYFFKTKEEFDRMIENDELLEWAEYVNNKYGTPKEYVFNQLKNGKDIILEIEMQGALQIKEKYPDTVLIFMVPPSAEELRSRLINRGTETEDVIDLRLSRASEEISFIEKYDYLVINDDIDKCVEDINNIVEAERMKVCNRNEMVEYIINDFKTNNK